MGKGGSSTTTSIDYKYNDRLASVAEEQMALTKEQYYATADAANAYQNALYASNSSLIPAQTEYAQKQLDAANALLPAQQQAAQKYYDASVAGVNVQDKMAQAQADVVKSLTGTTSAMNRDAARSGININSGAYAKQATSNAINSASAIAAARTAARTAAEDTNYQRLANASGTALNALYSGN